MIKGTSLAKVGQIIACGLTISMRPHANTGAVSTVTNDSKVQMSYSQEFGLI